jgi:hypothetical protein
LYAGTDDGKLHVTRNSGNSWIDLSDNIPNMPADRWINRIECSHHEPGTAYVAMNRYRNDDMRAFVFKTMNYGATWERLNYDLPYDSPVHVVRESSKNKNLLFAGTETGLFASIDGGQHWQKIKNGLPAAVPVHDLMIHPRERELVIATHGRSVYVMDISPLEQLNDKMLASDLHLFDIRRSIATPLRESNGNGETTNVTGYCAPNPEPGVAIHYYLRTGGPESISISICDKAGKTIATLTGTNNKGLNRVQWKSPEPGEYSFVVKSGGNEIKKSFLVWDGATVAENEKQN